MLDLTNVRGIGAAAIAATLLAAPAGAETLRLARHWVPPAHTLTASTIAPLIAAVRVELEMQVYPGGELGAGPLEQYVRAVTGVADIVWGLQGYT